MRGDRERLLDIQEAIERIERYAVQRRETFEHNELIQNWIIHHLQIIGEAVRALSQSFRDRHPDDIWSKIVGMRNVLVHDYFAIDTAIVWSAIENDLPNLKRKIEEILQERGGKP